MSDIFLNCKEKGYTIILESLFRSWFDALYVIINYRKSKTIFKTSLNSHVYWDKLYETVSIYDFQLRGREGNWPTVHSYRSSFYLFAVLPVSIGLPILPQTRGGSAKVLKLVFTATKTCFQFCGMPAFQLVILHHLNILVITIKSCFPRF